MEHVLNAHVALGAKINRTTQGVHGNGQARGRWKLVVRDSNGVITETREWENLVTTEGKNYLLSAGLDGGTQDTTWFVGLTDGTPTAAAGDTLVTHAGWVEVTAYTGNRKAFVGGTASGGSLDNSGSVASFAINADATTIGGAFLAAVDTGTSGILYAVGAFTGGDVVLNNGSTIEVTATFTV